MYCNKGICRYLEGLRDCDYYEYGKITIKNWKKFGNVKYYILLCIFIRGVKEVKEDSRLCGNRVKCKLYNYE